MELEKLIQIAKEWELDFKGDLLEGLTEDYDTIYEFVNTLVYEWFPIWIAENPENGELYEKYEYRISHLNGEQLEKEFAVYKELIRIA